MSSIPLFPQKGIISSGTTGAQGPTGHAGATGDTGGIGTNSTPETKSTGGGAGTIMIRYVIGS
jgi:hypothetical protein